MERYDYFKCFHDLPPEEYALLKDKLKHRTFKKNTFIVVPGDIQRELYFVRQGVQMAYFDTEHKSHVIAFTYFPDLCAVPESFLFQRPSKYFLTCLSDSELDYITFADLQQLYDQSQEIERLFRKMGEALLVGVINRHLELQALTMEERYKAFCRRSPHLLQLVPHKYLASYLNIDPTNFSKLFNTVKF